MTCSTATPVARAAIRRTTACPMAMDAGRHAGRLQVPPDGRRLQPELCLQRLQRQRRAAPVPTGLSRREPQDRSPCPIVDAQIGQLHRRYRNRGPAPPHGRLGTGPESSGIPGREHAGHEPCLSSRHRRLSRDAGAGGGLRRRHVADAGHHRRCPMADSVPAWRAAPAIGSWRAQWNRTPLAPQDRFSIGGRYTVRGFDGELTLMGERGWVLRNEIGLPVGAGQELYAGPTMAMWPVRPRAGSRGATWPARLSACAAPRASSGISSPARRWPGQGLPDRRRDRRLQPELVLLNAAAHARARKVTP